MSERQGRDLNLVLADAQVHDLSADTRAPMGQVVTSLSAGEERLGSQWALSWDRGQGGSSGCQHAASLTSPLDPVRVA